MTLIVVGLLVVVGGGALVLAGGDDDGAGEETTGTTAVADGADGSPAPGGQGDGGSALAGAGPEEVVERFIEVAGDGDCAAMISLYTEDMLVAMTPEAALDECESHTEAQPESLDLYVGLEVGATDEGDDTARVDVIGDLEGQTLLMVFSLVRDGDSWLIDDIS